MVLSGTISSLYSLLQYFNLDPIAWPKTFGNRPSSTLGHPDFLGDLLAMVIPLSLALCYLEKGWKKRSAWLLSILIQLGGLLVSQTRGAWIAATVSISTFFLLEPFFYRESKKGVFQKKIIVSLVAIFLFFGLVVSFLLVKPEFRYRAASILKIKEQTRIYLWHDSFKVIKEYPLFGSGPETFRLSFMPYKGIELAKMEKNVNYDNPHNNYLYIWATTGTLGLITYLYLLFCSFREGIRNLKENIASNPTFYLGILTSLEAYCIAMLTGFDTISTIFYFYCIIALIAVSDNHLGKKAQIVKPKHKRNVLVMIVIILSCLIIYDTSRFLLADHLTLKALKLIGKKPPHLLEARQILKRSCNLLPRESFYRLQLAIVNLKIGRKEVGKKDSLREAVHWGYLSLLHSWAPENSYNIIGTAYLNLRDCRSAEWACRRGLEIDPYNYPLRTNLAISLSCQGKRQEALNEVVKALSIDPNYSLALWLKKFLTDMSGLPELHHQP
jgi:O-antigen ligase